MTPAERRTLAAASEALDRTTIPAERCMICAIEEENESTAEAMNREVVLADLAGVIGATQDPGFREDVRDIARRAGSRPGEVPVLVFRVGERMRLTFLRPTRCNAPGGTA
jgi:hypothetical protein